MDQQLYEQVLLAVQVTHSPTCSPNERRAAYAFCEEFKQRDDCALYALAIYKSPFAAKDTGASVNAMEIHTRRHFALHVLEHFLLTRWSRTSVPEQIELRNELVDLLLRQSSSSTTATTSANPLSNNSEPVFLKEKKVAIIAQMAKRQFPQRWPNFLPELMQIWQTGSPQQIELILMVLRSLAEDCVSSNFNSSIPPSRRKDILQGLNVCVSQVFPVVYQELEKQFRIYKQGGQVLESKQLIDAALQMLKEFLDWMPLEKPVEPSTNLILVAVLLLEEQDFRQMAAECLEVYMSRTFGKENRAILVQTMQHIVDQLRVNSTQRWQQELQACDDDDTLELTVRFHRKVNDLLVMIGIHQLDVFVTPEMLRNSSSCSSMEITLLTNFLVLLTTFFAHPSCLVTETQIILWLSLLKHKLLLQHAHEIGLSDILVQLRRVCFEKYFKLGYPDRDDSLICRCSALEFDDYYEFQSFFGNFRGRLYALIRLVVQLDPQVVLSMALEKLQLIVETYPVGTDHLNPRGLCSEKTTTYLYHEGITSYLDCVLKQLPHKSLETNGTNQQLVQSILQQLLAFQSADPLLKYRQLFVLGSFAKYYVLDGNALTMVFERLFTDINFVLPGEDVHGDMSNDTMQVRRRALASLVAICQSIPDHILPVLPVLCQRVQELFAQDQVLDSESVLLYEMLVVVSNSMNNVEDKRVFVEQVAQEPLARWNSSEITALVSSPENLVAAVESSTENAHMRQLLFKVVKTLTTLYGISKRAGTDLSGPPSSFGPIGPNESNCESFASSWPHVLPNLIACIRSLHALQTTTLKEAILKSSSACWLLTVSIDEIAQVLGGKHQLEEEQVAKLPAVAMWSKWHKNIRDVCYHLIGVAVCEQHFYQSAPVAQLGGYFEKAILSDLALMDHRHLKSLLACVFVAFVKRCPRECYASLLDPVLTHLMRHLVQRFDTCFALEPTPNGSNGTAAAGLGSRKHIKAADTPWASLVVGVEEAKHEVVQEKMLMDLARQVVEFLEALIDAKTVVGNDTDNPKHVMTANDSLLREFVLFNSPNLACAIGRVLVAIICWKDTLACRKAVGLAEKMVNLVHSDVRFHELLGKNLFSACLQALWNESDHVKEDGLKWELINLVRNIYYRLTLGLTPVEECKGFDPCHQPPREHSSLCRFPRDILLSLPQVSPASLNALDGFLREKHSMKTQKNAMKEFLEAPMLAYRAEECAAHGDGNGNGNGTSTSTTSASVMRTGGTLLASDQVHHRSTSLKRIDDLPETLVLPSKQMEAMNKWQTSENAVLETDSLFEFHGASS